MEEKEKNEYGYFSSLLLFGSKSHLTKNYSIFSFDSFTKHPDIRYSESTAVNSNNKLETYRTIKIGTSRIIKTSKTYPSEINAVITYHDAETLTHVTDTLFSDLELSSHFKGDYEKNVQSKIFSFAALIMTIHKKAIRRTPLFINEFPNIVKSIWEKPDTWEVLT